MKSAISVYLELVTLGMACHEPFILYFSALFPSSRVPRK